MEELDLKELFQFFLSKIYIMVIITFCCVVVSVFYGIVLKKPMYQAHTTVVLAGANADTSESSITQSDITLNQKLISTYREIIKSRRISTQVIENLDLEMTPEALRTSISVTSESDTELIRITVSHANAKMSSEIANEIAHVFSKEIVEIYNIKNVSVIDKAVVPTNPYNMNIIKQLLITFFVAFVLSCGDILILFYFDTSIKSVEEVEQKIGLPILGSIPDSFKKGGTHHEK